MKYVIAFVAILATFFVVSSFTSKSAHADKSPENAEQQIEKLSEEIEQNPSNASLYVKRGRLYTSIGKYAEAAADLQMQCDLEVDPEVKELCELELKEYKAAKNLE